MTEPRSQLKVAVGSRAEAKAARRAAEDARRAAERTARAQGRRAASHDRVARVIEIDEAEGRASWTMLDAGAVLATMAASLFASDALLGSTALALMPPEAQYVARAVVLGVFHALQLAMLAFLSGKHGASLSRAFGLRRLGRGAGPVLATAGLVVTLLVATRAFAALWGITARAAGWAPPATGEITAVFGAGGGGLLVAIAIVVLFGPFVEELAFRGVLLRALGERLGMWPAISGSAALFASYHLTAWGFVPLFALGIACGWLAWTRRTIWGAVALHALSNAVVVGAAYWLAL